MHVFPEDSVTLNKPQNTLAPSIVRQNARPLLFSTYDTSCVQTRLAMMYHGTSHPCCISIRFFFPPELTAVLYIGGLERETESQAMAHRRQCALGAALDACHMMCSATTALLCGLRFTLVPSCAVSEVIDVGWMIAEAVFFTKLAKE